MTHPTADLVSRLRLHASRDNCISHDWGGEHHDAGEDCEQAADEIERLRVEDEQWDKTSLVEIIRERDQLRNLLADAQIVVAGVASMADAAENAKALLARIFDAYKRPAADVSDNEEKKNG
jgi:hypothetical protein